MSAAPKRIRVESPTEQHNPRTVAIDTATTETILALLHDEDARVIPAVRDVLPQLARLVDAATERVGSGGTVHYFGAGTSGRLAVLDAAELEPTYGRSDIVIAHHAGGTAALLTAAENVEDDAAAGSAAAADLTSHDVAIGLTASGRTPFVAGALEAARAAGAFTALVTANPQPEIAGLVDIVIAADTGPEAITGSTRMKAGTAEKLILNGFSTALMVKLGRTYSNLMITMQPLNAKLRGRSVDILIQATGEPSQVCAGALDAAGEIPLALTVLLAGLDPTTPNIDRCRAALRRHDGRVRAATAELAADARDRHPTHRDLV